MSDFHATSRGECDECHADDVPIAQLPDDEPGEWEFCEPCWNKVVYRDRNKLDRHDEAFCEALTDDVFGLVFHELHERDLAPFSYSAAFNISAAVSSVLRRSVSEYFRAKNRPGCEYFV